MSKLVENSLDLVQAPGISATRARFSAPIPVPYIRRLLGCAVADTVVLQLPGGCCRPKLQLPSDVCRPHGGTPAGWAERIDDQTCHRVDTSPERSDR